MADDTKQHYFACNLLWWSLRVSFGRPELLQAEQLAERIEDYRGRLDELGVWLMEELVRVGRAYLVGGESGMSLLDPPEIEQRVTHAVKALEALAVSAAPTDASRAYCVYVAECSWLVAILRAFVNFERSLSSDEVSARYRLIEDELRDVIAWIDARRDEIASERIQTDTLRALQDRTAPVIDAVARAWPDEVRADTARYPYSRSAAYPA
jgi:hypothetical protein